ncbi:hypothetical protein C8F04DRAFT_1199152 [Mycena alexandri]|uniref:Uncharacterized protein n=1 Tax=Mycena alexandri TaxID=1745969 RepID=A0AAD6S0I5_9AGAR|nr:hypothetical protein C8F04DRAFT_1199152 [Mycena alexandri]
MRRYKLPATHMAPQRAASSAATLGSRRAHLARPPSAGHRTNTPKVRPHPHIAGESALAARTGIQSPPQEHQARGDDEAARSSSWTAYVPAAPRECSRPRRAHPPLVSEKTGEPYNEPQRRITKHPETRTFTLVPSASVRVLRGYAENVPQRNGETSRGKENRQKASEGMWKERTLWDGEGEVTTRTQCMADEAHGPAAHIPSLVPTEKHARPSRTADPPSSDSSAFQEQAIMSRRPRPPRSNEDTKKKAKEKAKENDTLTERGNNELSLTQKTEVMRRKSIRKTTPGRSTRRVCTGSSGLPGYETRLARPRLTHTLPGYSYTLRVQFVLYRVQVLLEEQAAEFGPRPRPFSGEGDEAGPEARRGLRWIGSLENRGLTHTKTAPFQHEGRRETAIDADGALFYRQLDRDIIVGLHLQSVSLLTPLSWSARHHHRVQSLSLQRASSTVHRALMLDEVNGGPISLKSRCIYWRGASLRSRRSRDTGILGAGELSFDDGGEHDVGGANLKIDSVMHYDNKTGVGRMFQDLPLDRPILQRILWHDPSPGRTPSTVGNSLNSHCGAQLLPSCKLLAKR